MYKWGERTKNNKEKEEAWWWEQQKKTGKCEELWLPNSWRDIARVVQEKGREKENKVLINEYVQDQCDLASSFNVNIQIELKFCYHHAMRWARKYRLYIFNIKAKIEEWIWLFLNENLHIFIGKWLLEFDFRLNRNQFLSQNPVKYRKSKHLRKNCNSLWQKFSRLV